MQALRTPMAAAVALLIGGGAALAMPGAASAATVAPAAGVVINEVESNGDTTDWIELTNTSPAPVDVSGWAVSDKDDRPFRIAAGTVIQPGAFLVYEDIATDFGPENAFDFGLGKGDSARLLDASGVLVDSFTWTDHAATTFGRLPDGTGAFGLTAAGTKGAPNDTTPLPGEIVINEIESSGGEPGDWIELYNRGAGAIDLSGYVLTDNSPEDTTHRYSLPAGTVVAAGDYLVIDEAAFGFGFGGGDSAILFATDGTTRVDEHSWTKHAETSYGRVPNGTGIFAQTGEATKGAANIAAAGPASPVVINEVESNGGEPGDWVELFNASAAPVDISGWTAVDNNAGHTPAAVPAGTTLAPGAFYIFEEAALGFGLGSGDSVTLADATGTVVDSTTWVGHVDVTWARCADGTGEFRATSGPTKAALNACSDTPPVETPGPGLPGVSPWPGTPAVTPIAGGITLGEDMSGLDYQYSAEGSTLWAVDNGTGNLYRFDVAADGSVTPAAGWETPKRVRFQEDAANPAAAGPDAEGVTVSDEAPGSVFIGSERNNSVKGENRNTILKVNLRDATGPDVVATAEWDLTASLPQVSANTGIEAIEWVADRELEGKLLDENTGAGYDSANYPGANGLFFVAVEETADVYAYALYDDGGSQRIATLKSGLGGVMALDYDVSTKTLWGACDNGCAGTSALFTLGAADGSAGYAVTYAQRPAGLPDNNNEGFAIASDETCVDGTRAAWWLEDGVKADALKQGTIACAAAETPGPTETPGSTETPGATTAPGATSAPGTPGGSADGTNGSNGDKLATAGAEDLVLLALAAFAALGLGAFALTRTRRA